MNPLRFFVSSAAPGGTGVTRWEAIAILNVYGNAVLLAALALCGAAAAQWATGAAWWTGAIPCLPAAALLVWGIRITRRLPRKVRIATVLLRRVATHGYQAEYFSATCGDLCMRRLTWLVLEKSGNRGHFHAVAKEFSARDGYYIEHSSPELEALINSGAISEKHVHAQIAQFLGRRAPVLPLVAALLFGNACVETAVGTRTASVPRKEQGTSSKKLALTEVHATLDATATGPVVRGDVTVTVDVVPELSRPLPPIGSEPGLDTFAVFRVRALNKGARVREFDTLVGFPAAAKVTFTVADVTALGSVKKIVAQPGTFHLIEGQPRLPLRLYPDIEVTAFIRVSMPDAKEAQTVKGFIGLFDAAVTTDTAATGYRFPCTVTGAPMTGTYQSEWRERSEDEVEIATYAKVCACLPSFPLPDSSFEKQRKVSSRAGTRQKQPWKLAKVGPRSSSADDAGGSPTGKTWPVEEEETPSRNVIE